MKTITITFILSLLVFTPLLVASLCYFIGEKYPDLEMFSHILVRMGLRHNESYHFYSGAQNGTSNTIGMVMAKYGLEDSDKIQNNTTFGGYDNVMKVNFDDSAFGLTEEEIMKQDSEFQKNVNSIIPVYIERLQILYRKELFKTPMICDSSIQLSASQDPAMLHCFGRSVKNVCIGPIGSATRILASYILTLIERQMNDLKQFPGYQQINLSIDTAFNRMYRCSSDSEAPIDVMFYLGATPDWRVKRLLDAGKYGLMSISPSFLALFNKEFNLNMLPVDFQGKYEIASHTISMGTPAYLIASKAIRNDDALRMLKGIKHHKCEIYERLKIDTTSPNSGCCGAQQPNRNLPLDELDFLGPFTSELKTVAGIESKELVTFILSVFTLFFPVFRSIIGVGSWLKKKQFNLEMDNITQHTNAEECLKNLKRRIVDFYAKGLLRESHYNPLKERIDIYIGQFKKSTGETLNIQRRQLLPFPKHERLFGH